MNKWKLKITCPNGHSDEITLFYSGYEIMFMCDICPSNIWWEPTDKEFKENGVTVS